MIKVYNYNPTMQKEIKEFIINNMNKTLNVKDKETLEKITIDLENIYENYIESGGELLFAFEDNIKSIVGTIAIKYENNIAILKRFYVDEKYRNRKVGFLLYYELEKIIKKKNINKIYLTSGKELEGAHKFYEKNGWIKEENNPGIFVREGANLYKKEMKESVEMNKSSEVLKQAEILIEAIPYITEYVGEIMVIKYGGNAMVDENQKSNVVKQISLLKMLGIKVVLVHGGGPDIESDLKIKQIDSKFENGLRVTDKNTMDIVKMVLIGKTNSELVNLLNVHNCNAVGISGIDNSFIKCSMKDEKLGYVGKVEKVDTKIITDLLEKNYVPVISTIGVDKKGNYYNINADTVASEVAIALNAKKVIFLTNIDGLMDKNKKIISVLNSQKIDELISNGTISGGMIPKVKACQNCLENGVEKTHILNGSVKNTIIYEILSDNGIGTMII